INVPTQTELDGRAAAGAARLRGRPALTPHAIDVTSAMKNSQPQVHISQFPKTRVERCGSSSVGKAEPLGNPFRRALQVSSSGACTIKALGTALSTRCRPLREMPLTRPC